MRKQERGSTLVIFALAGTALLLMTGLAANVGMMAYQRTRMQAAADASALAGACSLDFGDQAGRDAAALYAQQNDFPLQTSEVSVLGYSRVTVHLSRSVKFPFGAFLQQQSAMVGATASADFQLISRGVRPVGIPSQILATLKQGDWCTLKYGSGGATGGNFQALDLSYSDPSGASSFERYFLHGSDAPCDSPAQIPTKTGNMSGPTKSAVTDLLARPPQVTFQTVLEEAQVNSDSIERYPQVITVLVIKDFAVSGKTEVDVVGFARFYLDSVDKGEIRARFIDECKSLSMKDKTKYHSRLVM